MIAKNKRVRRVLPWVNDATCTC